MIIEAFCKQDVIWEKRIPDSEDIKGIHQFEPGILIKCRATKQQSVQKNLVGDLVPTEWAVMTTERIEEGDRLTVVDDNATFYINVRLGDYVWLNGKFIGRSVFGATL